MFLSYYAASASDSWDTTSLHRNTRHLNYHPSARLTLIFCGHVSSNKQFILLLFKAIQINPGDRIMK